MKKKCSLVLNRPDPGDLKTVVVIGTPADATSLEVVQSAHQRSLLEMLQVSCSEIEEESLDQAAAYVDLDRKDKFNPARA